MSGRVIVYGDLSKVSSVSGSSIGSVVVSWLDIARKYEDVVRVCCNVSVLVWVPYTCDLRFGVVDIWGCRRLFAFNNSGCINSEEIISSRLREVEDVVSRFENVNAIILDCIRFPSLFDCEGFFSCFCDKCVSKAREYSINLEEIRNVLRRFLKYVFYGFNAPRNVVECFSDWIFFKQECVRDVVDRFRELCRRYNVGLWAAIFPPSFSWLVGQNYDIFTRYVDEIHVMLYRKCSGAACLNKEYQMFLKTIMKVLNIDDVNVCKILVQNLTTIHSERSIEELENGIEVEVVLRELCKAKILSEKSIPILWYDEHEKEITNKIIETARLDNYALFIV